MFATLIRLELAHLEELSRDELVAMLLEPPDFLQANREWLEAQSLDRLRLFVLAAKLLQVLRRSGPVTANRSVLVK